MLSIQIPIVSIVYNIFQEENLNPMICSWNSSNPLRFASLGDNKSQAAFICWQQLLSCLTNMSKRCKTQREKGHLFGKTVNWTWEYKTICCLTAIAVLTGLYIYSTIWFDSNSCSWNYVSQLFVVVPTHPRLSYFEETCQKGRKPYMSQLLKKGTK